MTTPDPLFERLRRLPRGQIDDVAAARTLARAEAAFAAAHTTTRSPAAWLAAWWVPAALGIWGMLYAGSAVREIARLFPAQSEVKTAVASCHRGSSGFDRDAQFMLNAMSKTSASTTAITTIAPPLPPALGASFLTDLSCEMSSDMDPSMTLLGFRESRLPNVRRGADRGRIAARTAARSEPAPHRVRATATIASGPRRSGA